MKVSRSLLLPYPAPAMFDLIEQAEHYPQFIPWCTDAVILERSDDWVAARLTMKVAGVSLTVETRNPKRRPEWLALRMVRGPLARFEGEWHLTPLNAQACRIAFTLDYEFADGVLARLIGPAFARVADTMVDAYVRRAERVLPTPAPAPEPMPEPATAAETSAQPPQDTAMTTVPASASTLRDALRGTRLAHELTDGQVDTLAAAMTDVQLKEGEVLVREGSADDHLYVLVHGVLGVVKNAGEAEQVTLNTLSAGDFAGELSWLDGQQRFASLVALSASRVIGLERAKLEALLTVDATLVYRVMRAIIRAVHQIQYRLSMQQSELSNYIYKQHGRY